ncbi:acyltransferase [Kovacikia minuta CCNUW1]|uniref:acyltransferase family protein n=1 Tax=Kovacikia minuta TaxID=2931930 RepID=UPI001CCE230B|nr:acyltransferase [Kovacikia minuta]UBF28989.1 acyltransferase [Kovacikia minuta CCNUW1]
MQRAYKAIAAPGWLGVHLFFVISGYCIAANVYRLTLRQGNSWTFIQSRFWRIFPTYWAAFLVTIAWHLVTSPFNKTNVWANLPSSWQSWLGNGLLIQPYLSVPFYVVVYWSLVVEIGFYLLVVSLLVIRNHWGQKLALLLGVALGITSVLLPPGFAITPLSYWAEFVCGGLLFSALWANAQNRFYQRNLSLFLIAILGIESLWIKWAYHSNEVWFSALFAIALYLLFPLDTQITSLKSARWLSFLGLISYSLYLLHVPFQGKIINLGTRFIPPESLLVVLLQGCGWGVAIGVSYVFYRRVEKPLNDWRHQQTKMTQSAL